MVDRFDVRDKSGDARKILAMMNKFTGLTYQQNIILGVASYLSSINNADKKTLKIAKEFKRIVERDIKMKDARMIAFESYYISNVRKKLVDMLVKGLKPKTILINLKYCFKVRKELTKIITRSESDGWNQLINLSEKNLIEWQNMIKDLKNRGYPSDRVRAISYQGYEKFIKSAKLMIPNEEKVINEELKKGREIREKKENAKK